MGTKVHRKVYNPGEGAYYGFLLLVASGYYCFHI